MDVADLAEEPGRQLGTDAEQLQRAGVGLGDGSLDAHLYRGDALLQLPDVGHELAGEFLEASGRP
jgi:hypothetical protein